MVKWRGRRMGKGPKEDLAHVSGKRYGKLEIKLGRKP